MLRLCVAAVLAGQIAAAAARAEEPVVVELFTSQGCSACPPADRLLGQLTQREDVIALSLHVDYWDYIGWSDTFAQPRFTKRQKAYAKAAGERMIYTPQIIIDGEVRIVGAKAMELAQAIEERKEAPSPVSLSVKGGEGAIRIEARIEPRHAAEMPGPILVQLVRYTPHRAVEIGNGENGGHTLDYHNIVTSWETIARWDGTAPLALDHPVEGAEPAVVLLQAELPGRVLAAAALR